MPPLRMVMEKLVFLILFVAPAWIFVKYVVPDWRRNQALADNDVGYRPISGTYRKGVIAFSLVLLVLFLFGAWGLA